MSDTLIYDDESMFDSAMASLKKPQDTRRLLKILVALRKKMEWPKDVVNMLKFFDMGCMKPLFAAMQRDNGSVLDVCLSILGNCAMEKYISRNLVQAYNILPILSKILKQHQDSHSVNGRVFRILGNLSQNGDNIPGTVFAREPEVIKYIVDYLKKCATSDTTTPASDASINMAIRAFREILNCQTIDPLVSQYELLQTIGLVLIKYSAKYREEKTNEELLLNILRFLHDYSRYKHTSSLLCLKNTGGGDSLQCLAVLTSLAPKTLVKIVMNLIPIISLKSDLPIPEICESLQKLIQQQVDTDKANPILKDYIHSLCTLLEHPANRPADRNNATIPFLIKILHELDLHSTYLTLPVDGDGERKRNVYYPLILQLDCCIAIITILQKCMLDESLIALQIKHDVIDVLMEKLEWITGTSNTLNLKHKFKKEELPDMTAPCKRRRKYLKMDHQAYLATYGEWSMFSYSRRPSSPDANSDTSSCYSGRSPLASPVGAGEGSSVSYSDDDYSPVCTDGEESVEEVTEEIKKVLDEEIEKLPEENETPKVLPPLADEKLSTVQCVLIYEVIKLLGRFSKVRPSVPQLGTMRVMKVLLKTHNRISHLKEAGDNVPIILEILESQEYLLPLLQTDFIPMVYKLVVAQHRGCVICKRQQGIGQLILGRLTILAESGCGKGDIAHQLMRGSEEVKTKLVMVLPYIIRNKSTLSQFMIFCGGLGVLMRNLQEKSELRSRSIKSLCMMALKKLRIRNPKNSVETIHTEKIHLSDNYTPPQNCENVVTFKLDNGCLITTDRNFLSEKSDYFNTLLNGQFRESQEDEIVLKNVDEKTFKLLLNLLNCSFECNVLWKFDLELETLLDVILLADRYLMVDLCSRLTESIEKLKICTRTVPLIYQWSVESGTDILRVETIAYALVANISDNKRFLMFQKLFDLGYSEELVKDIRKLLESFLLKASFCSEDADLP